MYASFSLLVTSLSLAVMLTGALPSPNPGVISRRADCSNVLLIHAAGTGETGMGIVGTPLASSLKDAIGATSQALDYSTSAEYTTTVQAGAKTLASLIESQASSCPDQKFALSGYSKGAMVVHATELPDDLKAKVCGITVFGDPNAGIANAVGDSAFPIADTANTKSFCNSGDPFCDNGANIQAHLAYATDGSVDDASSFLAGVCA